ncbi:MAG: hypothetical protein P8174_04220 [Gemmatimonadota bacterium]
MATEGMDLMFKRTMLGVALAPAFALGVALTAYAANGWHGDPSATQKRAPARCDSAQIVRVEHQDAVRLYELTAKRPVQIGPVVVSTAQCPNTLDRT